MFFFPVLSVYLSKAKASCELDAGYWCKYEWWMKKLMTSTRTGIEVHVDDPCKMCFAVIMKRR